MRAATKNNYDNVPSPKAGANKKRGADEIQSKPNGNYLNWGGSMSAGQNHENKYNLMAGGASPSSFI